MKRQQRTILIIFGLLDLLAVGGLGYLIWHASQPIPLPKPDLAPCIALIQRKIPGYLSPVIAWEEDNLHLGLTAVYDVAAPPESSVQLLWTSLDALAEASRIGCPIHPGRPDRRSTRDRNDPEPLAKVSGEEINAWASGRSHKRIFPAKSCTAPSPRSKLAYSNVGSDRIHKRIRKGTKTPHQLPGIQQHRFPNTLVVFLVIVAVKHQVIQISVCHSHRNTGVMGDGNPIAIKLQFGKFPMKRHIADLMSQVPDVPPITIIIAPDGMHRTTKAIDQRLESERGIQIAAEDKTVRLIDLRQHQLQRT